MSAVMTIPTSRWRIEGTREELNAVRDAVAAAVSMHDSKLLDSQAKVKKFEEEIASDPNGINTVNGHNAHMLEFWRGIVQSEQKELERLKLALFVAHRAAVVETRRRRL